MFAAKPDLRQPRQPEIACCVLGLGNPGKRYALSRHNLGFRVVDRLAEDFRSPDWQFESQYFITTAASREAAVVMCKPTTYMNLSGRAAADLSERFGLAPEKFLIVCDDAALPLGALRMRASGSSGGQNGLASVLESLASNNVPRLRCGIGPAPAGTDLTGYVLSPFAPQEVEIVEGMIERAAQAVRILLEDGIDRAMTICNAAPASKEVPEARQKSPSDGTSEAPDPAVPDPAVPDPAVVDRASAGQTRESAENEK